MSSIGIIIKADAELDTVSADWKPEILGSRDSVKNAIANVAGISVVTEDRINLHQLGLSLELEVGDDEPPRSVTVSGIFGEREVALLKALYAALNARLYDSEEACIVF